MRRIFFDVSFTRTQGGSVGITRTVRRLIQELLGGAAGELECTPVAFHTRGFRLACTEAHAAATKGPQVSAGHDGLAARLLRWAGTSRFRQQVTSAIPLPLLDAAWRIYSWITFDALSHDAPPVQFRSEDMLLLCDASWNYPVWVAARDARRAGARVVVMVHDLIPLRNPEFGAPLMTLLFRRWLPRMLACSDAVVCNSAATMRDLQGYATEQGWELPPTSHFRLGCDIAARADESPVRPELVAAMSSGTCFAAVGSIEARKNHALLLSAFGQLWKRGHDVRLVVLGRPTPECDAVVRAMASHPESGKRFLAVFDASDRELDYVYSSTRALVFPSLAEGFGLPLVEARTRGALVIASDIPVFRELADEGVLLFERSSPQCLCDRVLEILQGDGRTRIAPMPAFTWRDSARQLVGVARGMLPHNVEP